MEKYFVMLPDERVRHLLKLDFKQKELKGSEAFILYAQYDDKTGIPDFFCGKNLFEYFFCVSDRLKELFDIYAYEMEAIPFFITEEKKKQQLLYWNIRLPKEDIIAKKLFPDVTHLALRDFPKKNPYLFEISYEKSKHIAVSLHLAENILRKNYYGIRFVPIKNPKRKEEIR